MTLIQIDESFCPEDQKINSLSFHLKKTSTPTLDFGAN